MFRLAKAAGMAAALSLALGLSSANAGGYTVNWLDAGSGAYGVNNLGQIVGELNGQAAVWRNGASTLLGPAPSANSWSAAYAINDAGQVVGSSPDGHAALWENGVFTDLQSGLTLTINGSPIFQGEVLAINQAGDVAGQLVSRRLSYAPFQRVGGQVTLLQLRSSSGSAGTAINNNGQVAAISATLASAYDHAVLWTNGVVTELGGLGGRESYAYGLDDAGQVVGASQLVGNVETHATLWAGTSIVDLGTLGGVQSQASAINNNGLIVGWSWLKGADYADRATMWVDGAMVDLNAYLDQSAIDAGGVLQEATAVNELGWIVGNGWCNGVPRAFVLTPEVPEPSTELMLAMGVVAMAVVLRRRCVRPN